MFNHATFTSESVCAGHPDKLCDQISDAILDEVLRQDPKGRVAVETVASENKLVILGEISARATVDYEAVARREIQRLGYVLPELKFSDTSPIEVGIHAQSPEISQGVDKKGAGDQGMMFGYACKQTPELMPLPIHMAHRLARQIDLARERGVIPNLRPDGKTQVTAEYDNKKVTKISTVVLAVPHSPEAELEDIRQALYKEVVVPVLAESGFSIDLAQVVCNGTGVWHFSGPAADTGLTGRKIVVDTYGGYARVGGGCFSGKDPSKVDRSGAYAARYIAKNIVAHGLAEEAEVSLAYYIGAIQPIMKEINVFGTATVTESVLNDFVNSLLDCSVSGIIGTLGLDAPLYLPTAAYGHFGRNEFPWEQIANR